MHEASTLFEDLNIVSIYVKMCGEIDENYMLWNYIRNYIRHAVRDNFDEENNKRKNMYADFLGVDKGLQMQIGFSMDSIKIGNKIVQITDVKEYLVWAGDIFKKILDDSINKGVLKRIEIPISKLSSSLDN
jgi:hypothetical protein